MNALAVAALLAERHGPAADGRDGLALALVLIVLLVAYLLHGSRSERTPPGPVPVRRPRAARERQQFFLVVALVLAADVAIIVTERFLVLA